MIGAGRVGYAVAEKLCAERHSVIVIDQSESRLQRVEGTVHETWSGHVLSWDVEILQV